VTAWDILERDFGQSFINYIDREKACNELCKLLMAGDHVDKYITTFGRLVYRTDLKLNDPSNFQLFALGPPQKLAEQCILIKTPEMFVEWTRVAQRQQKNELKVRSIQGYSYDNTVSITMERSQQKSTGKWGWKRTGKTGRTWRRSPDLTLPSCLIPPDYDVDNMDGVATVREATRKTKQKRVCPGNWEKCHECRQ